MSHPELQLRQLCCERDERTLFAGLDCDLAAGELLQVVGPNGAGKTTLLRVVTGLSRDYDGAILWRGAPLQRVAYEYRNNLCYLGHQPGIKKALTPRENLAFYASLAGGYDRSAEELLAAVDLDGFEDVPCYQLSAGQQRRVALARLYGTRAPLWVLDEPFTAIDKRGVAALEVRLSEHLAGGGAAIITSHQALGIAARQLDLARYAEAVA